MSKDETKKNYNPPAWIVYRFDNITINMEIAKRFDGMRHRLCAAARSENHINYPFIAPKALLKLAAALYLNENNPDAIDYHVLESLTGDEWGHAIELLLDKEDMLHKQIDAVRTSQ